MKKRSDKGEDTLQEVMIEAIRKQATDNNYSFDDK